MAKNGADASQLLAWSAQVAVASRTLVPLCAEAVRKATFDTERDAKAVVAVDTGFLRSSIRSDFIEGGMTGRVGPTAAYGAFVEMGTSRMGPQPYLIPALEANAPKLMEAVEQLVGRLLG